MGQVKLARNRVTSDFCAVKVVPRASVEHRRRQQSQDGSSNTSSNKESDESKDIRTIREAAIGKLLHHPYICQLYEMHVMSSHYYMLFEYVSGGQMLDYIIAHGSLKEKQARKFSRAIASALDYCHHNSIVHRDLKIENILISQSGDIKIIDFGLSNLFSKESLLKTFCGSLYFAAPELLSAHPYTGPEIDVWSFGVVLYVLVCGKVPFDDQSMPALHAKIKRGFVEYPAWISSDCRDLLSRMLVVDPLQRATLNEVRHHPWMVKGYDKPPDSYIPERKPLQLPLDPLVIQDMSGFEFGDEDLITRRLTHILESPPYIAACKEWYRVHYGDPDDQHSNGTSSGGGHHHSLSLGTTHDSSRRSRNFVMDFYKRRSFSGDSPNGASQNGSPNASSSESPAGPGALSSSSSSVGPMKTPDPTNAYHPLLSIYYLVRERHDRERASKESRAQTENTQSASQPTTQQITPSASQSSATSAQNTSAKEPLQVSAQHRGSAGQSSPKSSAYSSLPPTSPGGPTSYTGYSPPQTASQQQQQQTEEKRFQAPSVPAPEAAHTSSSAAHPQTGPGSVPPVSGDTQPVSTPAPRARARAKTQGEGASSEKLFVFDSTNHASSTTASPAYRNSGVISNTGLQHVNSGASGHGVTGQAITHTAHSNTSSGGTGFATSLLRRFSSKRRPSREVSSPTNSTTYQKQAQQAQAQAHAQAQQTHAQVQQQYGQEPSGFGVPAARTQSRHQHSQSAAPAFADVHIDDVPLESPRYSGVGRTSSINYGNQRSTAPAPAPASAPVPTLNTATTPGAAPTSNLFRSASSKPYPKPMEPPQVATTGNTLVGAPSATAGGNPKVSPFSRKFHPSARAKSLGHVRHEMAAGGNAPPPRPPRDDLSRGRTLHVSSGTVQPSSAETETGDIADEFFDEYYHESDATDRNSSSNNSSRGAIDSSGQSVGNTSTKSNTLAVPPQTHVTAPVPVNTQSQMQAMHQAQHQNHLSKTGTRHAHSQSVSAGNPTTSGQNANALTTTTTSGSTHGMPSIEYPKQVFLKGFFSVQSTSTKPLAYIRSDIIRVLNQLGVDYQEIRGGFSCVHRPSLKEESTIAAASGGKGSQSHLATSSNTHGSPPNSPLETSSGSGRGHWRKLSFGSGFFSNRLGSRHQSEMQNPVLDFSSDVSTDSVAAGNNSAGYYGMNNNPSATGTSSTTSGTHSTTVGNAVTGTTTSGTAGTAGTSGYNMSAMAGGSDMLSSTTGAPSTASQVRTPLQFEIWIVRVPILQLHGVQFKKLRGNSWLYKNLATKILSELRL